MCIVNLNNVCKIYIKSKHLLMWKKKGLGRRRKSPRGFATDWCSKWSDLPSCRVSHLVVSLGRNSTPLSRSAIERCLLVRSHLCLVVSYPDPHRSCGWITSPLREYRSGDVIHPQLRCGSGNETSVWCTAKPCRCNWEVQ